MIKVLFLKVLVIKQLNQTPVIRCWRINRQDRVFRETLLGRAVRVPTGLPSFN